MNYYRTFIQYVTTILLTLFIYYLIQKGLPKLFLIIMVLLLSAFKTIYFSNRTFKTLIDITHSIKYLNFLTFVAFNIFYLVFSFSLDYYLIYTMDDTSFSGMESTKTIFEIYFKMFYLSFLLFTNMGVANVVPVSIPAECLVMFEAITSFATIIFILSDFVSLKDSLIKYRTKE